MKYLKMASRLSHQKVTLHLRRAMPPRGEGTESPSFSDALVGLTQEEYDLLQLELENARAEAQIHRDNYQRALADYQNLKRRVEVERNEMHQTAIGSVVKGFLEIGDDLERALKNRPTSDAGKAWADGIELVFRKVMNKLEAQGVKSIEAEGQMFDPHFHEAIGEVEDDRYESGQVAEVLAPGYRIGERVLRPAIVRVAA
ncbi:MAG: nucleotide exchange factor GrpE [Anaerolineae bacterium]|nr:nucleotide exchange factor GrpE [Anaerolineae bacterium]